MPASPVADLVEARGKLLDGGQPPRALRAALADLHDVWLAERFRRLGLADEPGVALVAVGALGRRELTPHSDLDLILLHDPARSDVGALAEQVWYPLWNARIGLDHSVRTIDDAVRTAEQDLRTAVGLLEARWVAGDERLCADLQRAVRADWRAGLRARLDELAAAARRRWASCGDVAHRAEPDLKNAHGGLRDLQLADALATGQLTDRTGSDVRQAGELLLDVRTELHRCTGRAGDILRAQDGDDVATALRLGDRFDLARVVSGAGRTVARSITAALAHPGRARSRPAARRPLADGVVEQRGEVVLAHRARPGSDPGLLLRVAAAAAGHGLPVSAGTLRVLADAGTVLAEPWPRAARDELVALLGAGRGAIEVIETLDRCGAWTRLIPEWAAVRDLPPRDQAHSFTVDRHLLETTAHAAELTGRVSRPDLLLLGALLHDIGKGRADDHSRVGAVLAGRVGARVGLTGQDVELLAAVVRHHLLLAHTATRRDVEDPVTVDRVREALDESPEPALLLDLLAALSEADGRATGRGVWTEWKTSLVSQLERRVRAVLAGRQLPGPAPIGRRAAELAEHGGVTVEYDTPPAAAGALSVTVIAPDRPGVLSAAAGVLALHSLRVVSATAAAHADAIVDTFGVCPRFGSAPDAALLRQDLARALRGGFDLAERLARKERDYQPVGQPAGSSQPATGVAWFDEQASDAAVLEVRAGDRIGLLYRLATALERSGVDIRWARIATFGSSAVDAFCLPHEALDRVGRPAVERAILAAAQ